MGSILGNTAPLHYHHSIDVLQKVCISEYPCVKEMMSPIHRKEPKRWIYDAFEVDDEVELATIGVRFPVAGAYEDVIFEQEKNAY